MNIFTKQIETIKKNVNPRVFFSSAFLVILFVLITVFNQESAKEFFGQTQAVISDKFGWFYVLAVNLILGFVIYLGFSRFNKIRIGGEGAKPEFSNFAWLSMLFNAGIGLVLMFYSVAEPILHFSNPPYGEPGTVEAAKKAINITYLHWGLHGWAVYALMGLAIAFFAYNKGFPLGIRWILYPIFGDKLKGPLGDVIDVVAVVSTMFGLATTLGLGIANINTGLNYLFNIAESTTVQVVLIGVITIFATISVVSGLHKGIQSLSKVAAVMAIILMLFMLIVGPTLFILKSTVQSTGGYLQSLIGMGTWTEAYIGTHWMDSWTFFYWAWWFAWAPFVGLFIARISKGRTIKEFVLGVVLGPTAAIILWISIFGNAAFYIELFGVGGITEAVNENTTTALFTLLEHFPIPYISIFFVVVAGIIFFVTSSDSGSLVIDFITSGGKEKTAVQLRVFWALLEGVVAAVLLYGGGLIALQAGSLVTGLPVCVIMLTTIYALHKALKEYQDETTKNE
jgi:choline/glycine/proline betaine transport protein